MAKPKGSAKTGGRKKGVPNKVTADLKTAILGALEAQGGQEYLEAVAKSDPRTFCALLGKVLPMQVTGDPENPLIPVLNIRLTAAEEIDRRLSRMAERNDQPNGE